MNTATMIKIYKSDAPHVVHATGGVIAETRNAKILSIEGQADIIFFPIEDVAMPFFDPSSATSRDPNLGDAKYFHFAGKSSQLENVAWQFTAPSKEVSELADYIAFDANKVTVETL